MNKKITIREFVKILCDKLPLTKPVALDVANTFFDTIKSSVLEGKTVAIKNFGKFSLKLKKSRKARNPRTGEEIMIPERKVFKFSPAKELKNIEAYQKVF